MRLGLAIELLKTSRLDEGIQQLRQTIKIDPNFAEAHYNLGIALGQQERSGSNAEREFREAIRLRPEFFNRLTAGSA